MSICGLPALTGLVLCLTLIKHETPKWHIERNERDKALEIIDMYSVNGDPEAICGKLEREMHRVKGVITLKQAVYTDSQYTKSTWIA